MNNPNLPEGYKPIGGIQYGPTIRGRSDEQKRVAFWRERNAEITARNQEIRAKSEPVTTLQEAYKTRALEVKIADLEREAEIAASPYALEKRIPLHRLPPNDILRQEAKRKYFETH